MSYFWRKCHVLMWKNLIVRKRHWFLTIFEIAIPILLFWLVGWMRRNDVLGQKATEFPSKTYPPMNYDQVIDYSYIEHDVVNFAYAPGTEFSRKVIAEFNKTFTTKMKNMSKLESFDEFTSEFEMEEYFHLKYTNMSIFSNYIGYAIVFENEDSGSSIPNEFKYKIRSTIPRWNTKEIFPQFIPAGPTDQSDQYLYKGFLAIQMALDNAYIKVAGGSPPFEMALQQFPFPSYKADIFNEIFKSLMPIITMLSFITITISVLKKVVEEKASGVQELMKMMGLQTWMVWAGWVFNGMMVYTITCSFITYFLCHEYDPVKGPVIAYVHFTIVFLFYLLFCLASIAFCFAISSLFLKPTFAVTAGMAIWMCSFFFTNSFIGRTNLPVIIQLLLCLVPMYNVCCGYVVIAAFESRELTITWLNLFSDASAGSSFSLGIIMVMFIVQVVFYLTITWYVTSIHPGPYGRAEPWYFIFQCGSRLKKEKDSMLQDDDDEYERYEAPPKDLKVGLKIQGLRKVFGGNLVAVDKVNMDIYEGQITALLGHNGAGKTTTMSILTGMYSPTSGSVYAKDYNIFQNMDRFRSSLGLCPQHDLLFPYLTPLEHLIFFGMMKGMSRELARSEGLKLLQMLHITEKKNVLASKLSGGMKRKLSLAIALIGSPQVLVLDEPTSGMDPESRREMWDLLLTLRGQRTILITTHFMEEADVLGDRIAIMDHGKVKCYGSTLFLKRIYGTGYQLTVMKAPHSPMEPITEAIKERVGGAEVKTTHSTQVTYTVPQEEAPNLPPMFAAIEGKKAELGITGVGISCTTMEEVFLKVGQLCREEKFEFDKTSSHSREQNMVRNTSNEALTYKKVMGLPLMMQRFISLVYKRSLFTIRRPVVSIIFLLLPVLLMWLTVKNGLIDIVQAVKDPPLTMKLSMYGETEDYVSGPYTSQNIYKELVRTEGGIAFSVDKDMTEKLLEEGVKNVARYKTRVIVAGDFNTTTQPNLAIGLFNSLAYHSAPISINMISNSLLQSSSNTRNHSITITNHPLDIMNFDGGCSQLNEVTLWLGAIMWLVIVPMGVKGFLMDFIAFPHNERTSNAKQLQLMTGVSPLTYWLACFAWDYTIYLICSFIMFITIYVVDSSSLFTEGRDYGVLLLILMLFGVSGIAYIYMYSFFFKSSNMAGCIFTFVSLVTGVIAPLVMYILMKLADEDGTVISRSVVEPINFILSLEPQYAFGSAILGYAYLLMTHSACNKCDRQALKDTMCKDTQYLEFTSQTNSYGILQFVLFLAFDWILYLVLILLIEHGYMSRALHFLKVMWVGKDFDKLLSEDADVRDERDRVDATRMRKDIVMTSLSPQSERECGSVRESQVSGDDSIVLTVDGLAKKFSRSFAAVQGVSFHVSAGECFGLLGVNGAGKTTTFRMLTGDENPTSGSSRILHYDLLRDRSKYLAQIGYCPQFDGINGFLTGEEVLRLFANLRGIPKTQIQPQIDEWISLLGLEEYRNRRCGKYSGGNKRKLSTAMSLIGDPPVVFLDEPTTGVDPVARRNLWDVLARCQKSGQAIILTSHSMEECEALCTRLTIMVRGRMMCIGSNQYLKQRYGQGYTIMIKLHNHIFSKETSLPNLKEDVQQAFKYNCNLKDEHSSLLHYHLTDTSIPLSQLFSVMEQMKQKHSIIEDYTVGDTTLEQVFIAFAKQADN